MKLRAHGTVLDEIVERARLKVSADKVRTPVSELISRIEDAPAPISFSKSISGSFGLIAEIKKRSPSQGTMRHAIVSDIARVYQDHPFVRAISMLTNRDDFGMSIDDLSVARSLTTKPILRKDFIFDEYQVYEARAYGADAILLMANVLNTTERMRQLFALAQHLGMDVLFECRSKDEINSIPPGAKIYGINSRKLKAKTVLGVSRFDLSRWLRRLNVPDPDRSVQRDSFDLVAHIPPHAIKVAESGLSPQRISRVRDHYRYNAALVGTAILNAPEGIKGALDAFWGARLDSCLDVPAIQTSSGHGIAV